MTGHRPELLSREWAPIASRHLLNEDAIELFDNFLNHENAWRRCIFGRC